MCVTQSPFGANLLVVWSLFCDLRHRAEDRVVPANARSVFFVRSFRVANLVKLRLRDNTILKQIPFSVANLVAYRRGQ